MKSVEMNLQPPSISEGTFLRYEKLVGRPTNYDHPIMKEVGFMPETLLATLQGAMMKAVSL